MKPVLALAAAFAAYEALHVRSTGLDIFYQAPIDQEYRSQAAVKWAAGAVALGYLAWKGHT